MNVSVILTVVVAILSSATTLAAVWLGARLGRRRVSDKEQYRRWLSVFDRPAFRGHYNWKSDPEPFEEAITLVLQAVNTGNIFNRAGNELTELRGIGKKQLSRADLQEQMDDVANRLQRIRVLAREQLASGGRSREVNARQIDNERDTIIASMNEKWSSFGFRRLPKPTSIEYKDAYEE